jgi:ABC-type bacteriocin/lantibiotic exporter with double-glycine peptidase domain
LTKIFLLGPVVGVLGMATPYITKLLIDEVYPAQDVTLMHVLVGGLLAISVTSSVLRAIQQYYSLYINTELSNATRLLFFDHLQHLKPRFYDRHEVGEINSRFGDVKKSLDSIKEIFGTIFTQGSYLLIVPPFLFYLEWRLALVALITIPLSVGVVALAGRYLRKYSKKSAEAYADLNALQVEALNQIRAVKSMALEDDMYKQADNQVEHAMEMKLKAGGMGQLLGMTNGVLRAGNTALFTWLGWTYILSQEMTLGSYIAFTSYVTYLYQPMRQFVRLFSSFQRSAVNLRRMFEYMGKPVEQTPSHVQSSASEGDAGRATDSANQEIHGAVEVRDLYFSYSGTEWVLQDVNLSVDPGTTLAVVGATGSGKTTLLRLLVRMCEPDHGSIAFNGRPVSQIPPKDLRRQVVSVWQDVQLFRGSIWTNLTVGLENVSVDRVNWAVKTSCLDPLIAKSKKGYETRVAEGGSTLSGGQRQRLALARALLRDAPVYILDEVTSNLDMHTEKEVLDRVLEALEDRTVIFVTHQIANARRADRICVLDDSGRIASIGSHSDLMDRCSLYSSLCTSASEMVN